MQRKIQVLRGVCLFCMSAFFIFVQLFVTVPVHAGNQVCVRCAAKEGEDTAGFLKQYLGSVTKTANDKNTGMVPVSGISTQMTVDRFSTDQWIYKNRRWIAAFLLLSGSGILLWNNRQKQRREKEEAQNRLIRADERHKADLEYQKKMYYQANYDDITGLYNKNGFLRNAEELQKKNPDTVYTFFRMNLEKFKMINEFYGVDVGNKVLREIAVLLQKWVRDQGVCARLYADQFAFCLPVRMYRAASLEEECIQVFELDGRKIRVQINMGIYTNYERKAGIAKILDYTQIALQNRYHSPNIHFSCYKDQYLETMRKNQKMINHMERGILKEEFKVFLQPQYELKTGKLIGAEALVRWEHPEEGMISPAQFIPVFEKNQCIYQLDCYVCRKVCELLAKWMENSRAVPVSVNLSRVDLEEPGLVSMICSVMKEYKIPFEYLHLEVTESAYVKKQDNLRKVIGQLREKGFCVEMDDFGSGYSSLNMLKDIPVDVLKMDMRFFGKEIHMERGGNIIEAVINMATSLGIMVIAEGVENEREANFLKEIQCPVVQGYLYGKPMPVEAFESRMQTEELGQKSFNRSIEQSIANMYWKMEKYDILLKNEEVALLDYDPFYDVAVYTYIGENEKRKETSVKNYSSMLMENPKIHPDYRRKLKNILQKGKEYRTEIQYLADYDQTGSYEWCYGVVYHYHHAGEYKRMIAVLKRGIGADTEKLPVSSF